MNEKLEKFRVFYESLTSGKYRNFKLEPCRVNGDEALAICVLSSESIMPAFVSVTDAMVMERTSTGELTSDNGPEKLSLEDRVLHHAQALSNALERADMKELARFVKAMCAMCKQHPNPESFEQVIQAMTALEAGRLRNARVRSS